MKKLLTLAFAFVFMTGVAFAQSNEATVSQTGNNDEVTVDQIGELNEAVISQSGNFNEATAYIDQEGTSNFLGFTQTGAGDHQATLTQIGTGNSVDRSGFSGSGNNSIQRGAGDHFATAVQDGNGNQLTFQQRSGGNGDYLNVLQDGDDNWARVLQRDDGGHVASIVQDGNHNSLNLEQRGSMQSAHVDQMGDSNTASITQSN